jgi:hypothetical protein
MTVQRSHNRPIKTDRKPAKVLSGLRLGAAARQERGVACGALDSYRRSGYGKCKSLRAGDFPFPGAMKKNLKE